MFRRLFWVAVGMGIGFGVSFWLARFVRQAASRFSPDRVRTDLADALQALARDFRSAVSEGREAMRDREEELRRLGAGSAR